MTGEISARLPLPNQPQSSTAKPKPPAAEEPQESVSLSAPHASAQGSPTPPSQVVKILTLNDLLDAQGGVDAIAGLIRTSGADIVGLQETHTNTGAIAQALGFNYLQQGDDTAVLSRFPIEGATPNKCGVTVGLDSGQKLEVFNVHLDYLPYQPYQLLHIPYGDAPFLDTEAQAVQAAQQARGATVQTALQDLATVDQQMPVVLTGDFNEPSHLDWTQAAADAGHHPIKVEWPSTKAFADTGLQDSYRQLHPDEVAEPGYTWTPTTAPDDPKDHHDRIDFVMYRGQGLKVQSVDIVGENDKNATIVVDPYPTDHRGVLGTFNLAPPPAAG